MAFELIKINEFPHLDNIVGSELLPLGRATDGNGVHVTMQEFKDWIGFEQFTGVVPQKAPSTTLVGAAGVPAIYIGDAGTYTLNGGAATEYPEAVNYFFWDGSAWNVLEVPVEVSGTDTLNPTGEGIPKEKAVADYAPSKSDVGIVDIKAGDNLLLGFRALDNSDPALFDQDTFYNKNTGIKQTSSDFVTSVDLVRVYGGMSYDYEFNLYGNAGVPFFDADGNMVQVISTTSATSVQVTGTITLLPEVVSMGFTNHKVNGWSLLKFEANESKNIITDDVFATSDGVDSKIQLSELELKTEIGYDQSDDSYDDDVFLTYNSFEQFGFKILKEGNNIFPFLQPADYNDTEVWQGGFLRNNGTISASADWFNTKDYYKLPTGSYTTNLFYSGNSYMWVVDESGNMIRALQSPAGGVQPWSFTIDNAAGEYGIKIGLSKVVADGSFILFVSPDQSIYLSPNLTGSDISARLLVKDIISKQNPAKRIQPIITFISDDGSTHNDWFIEALDTYGYKATFAIITGRFNSAGFYSKEQVVDILLKGGHEVAGHTVTHNSLAKLNTLTVDQLHYEIGKNKFDLLSLDDRIEAVNFISPFGSRNLDVDLVVRQYYEANYVTRGDAELDGGTAINYPVIDNFNMRRVSFDVALPSSGAMDVSRIDFAKSAVDKVNAEGGWLIFAIHPHYAQYIDPANTVDSKQELRDLLAYINGLDIPVLTAKQARKHYANYSIGNTRLDASYYERGSDGTELGTYLDV